MRLLTLFIGYALLTSAVVADGFKDHIFIQLESFKSPSIKLNIHDGKILFRKYYGGHMFSDSSFDYCISNISHEEFTHVLDSMRDIGFFEWNERYNYDSTRDGSFFRITIAVNDDYHVVNGFNKYPKNFEKIELLVEHLSEKYGCLR